MGKKINDIHHYEDIIKIHYKKSNRHPPMSLNNRAAQFSPFAALAGHEQAINETARKTTPKIILDEDEQTLLNQKLAYLLTLDQPEVVLTYFVKDEKKSGGRYVTIHGQIKKLTYDQQFLILVDKTKISLEDILDISSPYLSDMAF